jgi:hypothetical protein
MTECEKNRSHYKTKHLSKDTDQNILRFAISHERIPGDMNTSMNPAIIDIGKINLQYNFTLFLISL